MFSHFWTTGRPQFFLAGLPISSVVAPRSFFLHLCNGTYQELAYADDANLIGVDIKTIEVNTDVVLNARKDIGLAVNTRKTMYMDIGRHGGMTTNDHIRIGINFNLKVKTFKYCRLFCEKSKF
jgi:hypothetical protein